MRTGRVKFLVIAGCLIRRSIRKALNNLVASIQFHSPDSVCYVHESKSFLESEFIFVGQNIPKNVVEGIEIWYKKMKESTE